MKTLTPRELCLLAACMALAVLTALLPPLAQPDYYTHFADTRPWFGVPYAMDVLSNLPFALAGLWGLRVCRPRHWPRCRAAWPACSSPACW